MLSAEPAFAPAAPASPPRSEQPDIVADDRPAAHRDVADASAGGAREDDDGWPELPAWELPDSAPACSFGEVTLIVASDPAFAVASIRTAGERSQLYNVGSQMAGNTIVAVSWDRVWFDGEEGACEMRLGVHMASASSQARAPKATKKKKRKGKKGPTPVPEHISSRIQQTGPFSYTIERSAFDAVFEMDNGLVRGTRVRPVKDGDAVRGMSFNGRGVAEGSLLRSIGIRAGDVLQSVNDFKPTNAQKALEAYGRLKTADRLTLVLERAGRPVTIDYRIQ